jgi:uncharacterized protein
LIKTRLIQLLMCILIFGGSEAVAAPSGGCAAARGSVAQAICGNPKLSQLNREERALYRKALLVGDRRSRMNGQWTWIIERNRTCGQSQPSELENCITQSLNARIVELRSVLEPAPTTSEKLAVVLPPTQPARAPKASPSCGNAIRGVDGAICNDAMLSHWEDRLGKFYQKALDDPSSRSVLAQDQQRWIGERTSSCGALSSSEMTNCVLQMTKRRVEQLVLLINSRDDSKDRPSKVDKILSGKTTTPPGLDADSIDRESAHADQSELVIEEARTCIRKNLGSAKNVAGTDPWQAVALMSAVCFNDFSKKLSALELGALAKPSFEMLVRQEMGPSK